MTISRRYLRELGTMPFRSSIRILPVFILSLVMVSCSESTTDSGPEDEPGPNEVQMVGHSFTPSVHQVVQGTTVTWVNISSEVHTVTSGANRNHDGRFDSGNVPPGAQFSYTFSEVGNFPYFCIPHAGMNGTIVVIESDNDDDDDY
jgi:plastocyanin